MYGGYRPERGYVRVVLRRTARNVTYSGSIRNYERSHCSSVDSFVQRNVHHTHTTRKPQRLLSLVLMKCGGLQAGRYREIIPDGKNRTHYATGLRRLFTASAGSAPGSSMTSNSHGDKRSLERAVRLQQVDSSTA